jgi:hypothetical protein
MQLEPAKNWVCALYESAPCYAEELEFSLRSRMKKAELLRVRPEMQVSGVE